MSDRSSIEWTEATWNPVRGCDRVSPGCGNPLREGEPEGAGCYAETFAERWRGVPGHAYERGFDLRLAPEQLAKPLSWRKPRRIFVNSMSDLFHGGVPNEYIAAVWGVMAACPQHIFQILTKRATRLPKFMLQPDLPHRVARARDSALVDHAHDPIERWKSIPGFENYEASTHGRIRSPNGVMAMQFNETIGRDTLTLWRSNEPHTMPVHRLVALAHLGAPEEGHEVCHRNGNSRDNRLVNLRWGTRSENQREKVRHGSRGGPQRIDAQIAAGIREARRGGATQQAVADRFGVSRPLVSLIENGRAWGGPDDLPWPLPNVHIGVSVENRQHGLPRIDYLRRIPAALRFLSIEPLLEDIGEIDLTGIGWVIVGAESGHRARPMDDAWVRSIRDQCAAASVPLFFKQRAVRGRKVSLPILDGVQHAAFPEVRAHG
jgi:protein gp37